MKGKKTMVLVVMLAGLSLYLTYRAVFIRTVTYSIGDVKITSTYNVLTAALSGRPSDKAGLSEDQVAAAQIRWNVFEEWVKSRKEFEGWQEDPAIFKKAHDAFRKEMSASKTRINIVR